MDLAKTSVAFFPKMNRKIPITRKFAPEETVTLETGDATRLQTSLKIAVNIGAVSQFVEQMRSSVHRKYEDSLLDLSTEALYMPKITGRCLQLILKFITHHDGKWMLEKSKTDRDSVQYKINLLHSPFEDFDEQFFSELSRYDLMELSVSAQSLDIPLLLDFTAKEMANRIKQVMNSSSNPTMNARTKALRKEYGIYSSYGVREDEKGEDGNKVADSPVKLRLNRLKKREIAGMRNK